MIRLLHFLAISMLIGSAAYAYSIKYESLFYAEEVAKLKGKLQREREAIAVAKAEWSLLTRLDRLQRIADQNLGLQPMGVNQLARLSDLPVRPPKTDAIGSLLQEPNSASKDRRPGEARAPAKSDTIGSKLEALMREPGVAPKAARPAEARAPFKADPPAKTDPIGTKLEDLMREAGSAPRDRGPDEGRAPAKPEAPAKADPIGSKLEALMREPSAAPKARPAADSRNPATTGSLPKAAR